MKRQAEGAAEDGGGLLKGDPSEQPSSEEVVQRFAPEDISRSLLVAIRFVPSPVWMPRTYIGAATILARSHICSLRSTISSTSTLADPSFDSGHKAKSKPIT